MKKTLKTGLAAAIAGMLVLSGVVFFRIATPGPDSAAAAPSPERDRAPVETVAAVKGEISDALALTGTVAPYRVARLASPAEGPVADVRVREGDRVTAGAALLTIGRKKGLEALVESLRVTMEIKADQLERTQKLVDQDAVPREEKDQARAAYESARAELVRAEESASDHVITAPWAGVVSDMFVKAGGFVAPRETLLEIYDPKSLVIRAAVPERRATQASAGTRVDIRLDAHPGEVFKGRIDRSYPYLDPVMRTRTVEIRPEEEIALLPGMFARLSLLLETVEDAVLVPSEAVRRDAEDTAVFVVENNTAVRRVVETGVEKGGQTHIRSGVEVGERVIVAGMTGLSDGDAVSPTPSGRYLDLPGGAGGETQ